LDNYLSNDNPNLFSLTLYNPTLSLYFMKSFQRECEYPTKMLDSNLAMGRGKIRYISLLSGGNELIIQLLSEAKEPVTISELSDRFGVEDMISERKDEPFMASLLYYFGVLTMAGKTLLVR
jgi:hypothetical protein